MPTIQKIRKLSDAIHIHYRMDPSRSFPGDDFIIAETWEWNVYLGDSWEIEKDAIIIDVGAHIGAFSLLGASKATNGIVYAYEPFPDNYNLLRENISLNKISNVIAVMEAISGKRGRQRLYLDPKSQAGHSLIKKTNNWIDVTTITLVDLFERHDLVKCDFLKLDCEGAEQDIILETPLSTLQRIRRIALEYHAKILGEQPLYKILERLKAAGFDLVAFNRDKLFLPVLFERAK